jgi:hypothetical protein
VFHSAFTWGWLSRGVSSTGDQQLGMSSRPEPPHATISTSIALSATQQSAHENDIMQPIREEAPAGTKDSLIRIPTKFSLLVTVPLHFQFPAIKYLRSPSLMGTSIDDPAGRLRARKWNQRGGGRGLRKWQMTSLVDPRNLRHGGGEEKGNANLFSFQRLTMMMSTMAMNGGVRITSGAEDVEQGKTPGQHCRKATQSNNRPRRRIKEEAVHGQIVTS